MQRSQIIAYITLWILVKAGFDIAWQSWQQPVEMPFQKPSTTSKGDRLLLLTSKYKSRTASFCRTTTND